MVPARVIINTNSFCFADVDVREVTHDPCFLVNRIVKNTCLRKFKIHCMHGIECKEELYFLCTIIYVHAVFFSNNFCM